MRRRTIVVLVAISLCTVGCSGEEEGGEVHNDATGSADYYLHNQSSHDLLVECVAGGGASMRCDHSGCDGSSGATVRLGGDTTIGATPKPTDSFQAISASAVPSGATEPVVVYLQNPIDNAAWVQESWDTGGLGESRYTLVLEDSDLAFP